MNAQISGTWLRKPVLFKNSFLNEAALISIGVIFFFGIVFFMTKNMSDPISGTELVSLESRLEALKPIQGCDTGNDDWLKIARGHVPADAYELRRMLEKGTPITKHTAYLTNLYIDRCQEKIADHFADIQRNQEYQTRKSWNTSKQIKLFLTTEAG